jgi:hypothetical protein
VVTRKRALATSRTGYSLRGRTRSPGLKDVMFEST